MISIKSFSIRTTSLALAFFCGGSRPANNSGSVLSACFRDSRALYFKEAVSSSGCKNKHLAMSDIKYL